MWKNISSQCHTGVYSIKRGRITVNNIVSDKNSIDLIRKQIAWIPQELALPLEWVKDMIQLPFSLKANRATPFSEMQLFNCFEELGLEEELYYKRVNEISGGQRQRMMIAVASMINKPLNHCGRADFGTLIRVLRRECWPSYGIKPEREPPYWQYRTTWVSPKDATDI